MNDQAAAIAADTLHWLETNRQKRHLPIRWQGKYNWDLARQRYWYLLWAALRARRLAQRAANKTYYTASESAPYIPERAEERHQVQNRNEAIADAYEALYEVENFKFSYKFVMSAAPQITDMAHGQITKANYTIAWLESAMEYLTPHTDSGGCKTAVNQLHSNCNRALGAFKHRVENFEKFLTEERWRD